jgi:MFS family permease
MSDPLRLRSNLWKLKAIKMLFWMHFFAAVLVPFYTEGAHLSLSQVLFLNSWFMLWNFVLEVPTGTVADYFGRKWSLALGAVIGGMAALVYVSSLEMSNFLLGEVLFALAYTLNSGADEALAYDTLKALREEQRAKGLFAQIESFKLGGIIIATMCGGFIASHFGLTAPMMSYVIPAALALLLSLTLQEPPVTDREGNLVSKLGYRELLRQGFAFFRGHPVLLTMTAEICLTNALAWGLIWLFQPLLARAGVDIRMFGVVHALACGSQILFLNSVHHLEGWFKSKRLVLLFCSFATGLAFVDLAFVDSKFLVAFAIIVGFTFSLPRVVLFSAYMNQHIPSDKRATVLSVSSMFRTLMIVIMNLITGWLADWNLSHTMVILGTAIIVLAFLSRIEERHLGADAAA